MTELVAVGFIYIDAMPEQAGEGLAGAMRELNRRSATGNAACDTMSGHIVLAATEGPA